MDRIYQKLYHFQKEAFEQLKKCPASLLALDLGLGKTITASAIIEYWIGQGIEYCQNIILVCQTIKVNDWNNELNDILQEFSDWKIIHLNKIKNNPNLIKTNPTKSIFMISYQMFANLGNFISQDNDNIFNEKTGFVYDECQTMKDLKTKISKVGLLLASKTTKMKLMISGDPISNGYKDLFVLMKILDFQFDDWNNLEMEKLYFDNFFVTWKECKTSKGYKFKVVTGYKNTDYLIKLLHTKSVFKKTEEVIELPTQNFFNHYLKIGKKEKQIIQDMVNFVKKYRSETNYCTDVTYQYNGTTLDLNGWLDLFRYSRCIGSGFIKDKETIIKLNDDKLQMLDSLVMSTNKNIVIFYNFNYELKQIKTFYQDKKTVVEINGEHHLEDSLPLIQEKNTLILVQYKSGATGINLQKYSNIVIYYSLTTSGELYKQSQKRIHRIGQEHPCFYYHLITCNTVEEQIYETIKQSQTYTEKMFVNWIEKECF